MKNRSVIVAFRTEPEVKKYLIEKAKKNRRSVSAELHDTIKILSSNKRD